MVVEKILYTDNLRNGTDKINAGIDLSNASKAESASAKTTADGAVVIADNAVIIADNAVIIANTADGKSDSTQTQLNNIVIASGTSDAETIQARGTETLLYKRLDKTDQQLALKVPLTEQIKGKPNQKFQMIGGAIRNSGTGWAFIADTAHAPTGLSSVAPANSTTLRVSYDFTAVKVGRLVFGTDETFQKKGIQIGASVGLTFADVKFSSPLNCVVMGDGIISAPAEHLPTLAVTKKSDSSGFTLNHYGTITTDTPVVVIKEDVSGNTGVDIRLGVVTATSVEVLGYSEIGGYVLYNATSGLWEYTGVNITTPTFAFNGTNGILSITHEGVLNDNIMAVVQSNFKDYRITSAGNNATKINFQFVDNAGVVALTPNANMKFYFARLHKVKSRMATTTKVAIRRGNVDINPVNLVDAGGNFWMTGEMEI